MLVILAATLIFLFGLIVINALHRHAKAVTIVLTLLAAGLFIGCAELAGANMPAEVQHWDPALDIVGD
jgi:hypothetical protein